MFVEHRIGFLLALKLLTQIQKKKKKTNVIARSELKMLFQVRIKGVGFQLDKPMPPIYPLPILKFLGS